MARVRRLRRPKTSWRHPAQTFVSVCAEWRHIVLARFIFAPPFLQARQAKKLMCAKESLFSIFHAQYYIRFIRWSFARFYREFAWTYDTVAWLVSRGLWRRWTLAALPYISGRVLELGCGTGYVQATLAQERSGSTVGLDASPQMLALTRRRANRYHLDLRLLRAMAQALPFAPASFDSVLATFPAEYILHPATAAEIQRVLAPNGRLVIIDAAQFSRSGLYERIVDLAYRLTLQSSVRREPAYTPYMQKLDGLGFRFETYWEQVGPSRVMVLIGKR